MELLQITVGLLTVSAIVAFVSGSIDGDCKQVQRSVLACEATQNELEVSCDPDTTISIMNAKVYRKEDPGCLQFTYTECMMGDISHAVSTQCDGYESCNLLIAEYRAELVGCNSGEQGEYSLSVRYKCVPVARVGGEFDIGMCDNRVITGSLSYIHSYHVQTGDSCLCWMRYESEAELAVTPIVFDDKGIRGCDYYVAVRTEGDTLDTKYVCRIDDEFVLGCKDWRHQTRNFTFHQYNERRTEGAEFTLKIEAATDTQFTLYCGDEQYIGAAKLGTDQAPATTTGNGVTTTSSDTTTTSAPRPTEPTTASTTVSTTPATVPTTVSTKVTTAAKIESTLTPATDETSAEVTDIESSDSPSTTVPLTTESSSTTSATTILTTNIPTLARTTERVTTVATTTPPTTPTTTITTTSIPSTTVSLSTIQTTVTTAHPTTPTPPSTVATTSESSPALSIFTRRTTEATTTLSTARESTIGSDPVSNGTQEPSKIHQTDKGGIPLGVVIGASAGGGTLLILVIAVLAVRSMRQEKPVIKEDPGYDYAESVYDEPDDYHIVNFQDAMPVTEVDNDIQDNPLYGEIFQY